MDIESGLQGSNINWVWRLLLPSKLKPCLWRVAHNAFSIGANLIHILANYDNPCPRCGQWGESLLHTLWECPNVKIEWNRCLNHVDVEVTYNDLWRTLNNGVWTLRRICTPYEPQKVW